MISNKMAAAINKQVAREMYSSYLYRAMSLWSKAQGLPGFAAWLRMQAAEEMEHAEKFISYLEDQGAVVKLEALDAPPAAFKSPLAVFEETLKHEKQVTAWICELMKLAKAEGDYATEIALQWFITEQVEEEANATEILDLLKKVGNEGRGLYLVDHQLGKRGAGK